MASDIFDPDVVVRRLARDAKSRLSADAVAVWLLRTDHRELTLGAALGFTHESTARLLAHRSLDGVGEWLTSRRLPSLMTVRSPSSPSQAWLVDESIRSMLVVPLVAGDATLGLLAAFRRRRPFAAAHLANARQLADANAITIHAALGVAEARARVERAEALLTATQTENTALHEVTATLTSTLDLPTVLEAVADAARTLIGAHLCAVFELDGGQRLVPRVSRGLPVGVLRTVEPGEGAVGAAAHRRAPFFTPDWREHEPPGYAADHAPDGDCLRDAVQRQGIRSVLAVPVISKDTLVGVVSVAWDQPHTYDEREVRLLTGLARQAAVALDNARLYDEAQRALADLRAMQQKLVRGETLRALGELAGGAAHHLNNLLTVVVGRVQLLLRGAPDEALRRALTTIERAAKDGAEVVRRLQQFSRRQQVGRMTTVTLDDVARDVLGLTRGHWQDDARARGVSIDVEQRLAGGTTVEGDAVALREAVTNIVLNAIDAMPNGGRLSIHTRVEGSRVSLAITDTGVGMSESVRLKAHEPFFTTKGVKATGLGLSVAYGIVRSHGGELTLDSGEGRGTIVTLTLPHSVSDSSATRATTPRDGALRLLLVDDEAEVREALAEMLASQGHSVVTAAGADEAFERLERETALDLVLTDLVMPGRTGWDVAAHVKARWPRMPVGLITGWGDAANVDEARRAMVDFVVEKPVNIEVLQQAVARARAR